MTSQPSAPEVSSYEALRKPSVLIHWSAVATLAGAMLIATLALGNFGLLGVLLSALAVCFVCVRWYSTLHTAYRLELAADTLRWRFPLGGGEAPISDLTRMRSAHGNTGLALIEFARRRPVRVLRSPGLEQFAVNVQKAAPQLENNLAALGYRRYR
jgi:hypothetical protein